MKIRVLGLCVALLIFPWLIGMLFNKIMRSNRKNFISNWVNGFIFALGSFQVFVLPCILFRLSLVVLTSIYCIFIIGISCVSFWINRNEIIDLIKKIGIYVRKTPWQSYVAVILVLLQMCMYFFCVHTDDDDAFYVATSVVAVDTNTVYQFDPYTGELYTELPMRYVLSPFSIFTAVLSEVSGIHATTLSHTVLPVIYLGISYAIYVLIGTELFKGKRKDIAEFIIWIALISMFLNNTVYLQNTFMLVRIWQGKAFLAAALLPYVFYLGYRNYMGRSEKNEWIMLFFTMLACTLVSSMGIILGAVMTGIMGILIFLKRRDLKIFIEYMLCCVPNIILAFVYIIYR